MAMPEDAFAAAMARALALVTEMASRDGPQAAEVCHQLAAMLDGLGALGTAEILHHRAGVLLAAVPVGGALDRQRVQWALCLADNLEAQHRMIEAAEVLRAANALAEGLLGHADPDTTAVEARLWAGGQANE